MEVVIQKCSVKKMFLKNLAKVTGRPLCESPFSKIFAAEKEIVAQVFSSEYYEIFNNILFKEHLQWLPLVKFEPSL